MGSKERKEKEKRIRQNDIVDAAERVFFAKGFEKATMDDVAREAEFSKRTLYVYFPSKEQLYLAIMLRAFQKLNSLIEKNLIESAPQNGMDKLEILMETWLELNQKYPDYFKAIHSYENREVDFQNPDEITLALYEEGEKTFQLSVQSIEEGMQDQSIREDIDVVSTVITLWEMIIRLNTIITKKEKYIKNYYKKTPRELVKETYQFIQRSLKKNNSGN